MDPHLSPLPPLEVPKPPKKTSLRGLVSVFASAFLLLLLILNFPAIWKAATYPLTHSEEKDNEKLTQQYRSIYGYEKHPEFSDSVFASTPTPKPRVELSPNIQSRFQAELSIPKLGVTAPVLSVPSTEDTAILNALKNGVVLFPGSVNPGEPGSSVIIGHSSSNWPWTKYSAVFSLLDKLQPNDLIYVTVNGKQHTYRVRSVHKGSAQELIDTVTGDLILSTCWPVGTDTNRMAVSASLIQ